MVAGALRLLQLYSCGLLAGAWGADWLALTPVRSVVTPSTLIIVEQGIHAHLRGIVPVLILVALVSGVGALLLLRRERHGARYALLALGTAGLIAALIIFRLGNAPIDTELMNWTPNAPPERLRELWRPWERANTLRTLVTAASFLLLCLAAVLPAKVTIVAVSGESA